jgi:hypothetical protein
MADTLKNLIGFAGFYLSGDLGPYTVYTNKNRKKVVYDRAPPDKPPSLEQLAQRLRFTLVAQDWKLQSTADKATWEFVTLALSLPMTGYNLFTFAEIALNERPYLETIFRQAHNTTIPPYTKR